MDRQGEDGKHASPMKMEIPVLKLGININSCDIMKEINQMQFINVTNVQDSELNLHDSLLQDINISYKEKSVLIFLILPKFPPLRNSDQKVKLLIENASHFVISIEEPWGEGTYIVSEEIKKHSNDRLKMEITLNSGDTLNIIGEKISFC